MVCVCVQKPVVSRASLGIPLTTEQAQISFSLSGLYHLAKAHSSDTVLCDTVILLSQATLLSDTSQQSGPGGRIEEVMMQEISCDVLGLSDINLPAD